MSERRSRLSSLVVVGVLSLVAAACGETTEVTSSVVGPTVARPSSPAPGVLFFEQHGLQITVPQAWSEIGVHAPDRDRTLSQLGARRIDPEPLEAALQDPESGLLFAAYDLDGGGSRILPPYLSVAVDAAVSSPETVFDELLGTINGQIVRQEDLVVSGHPALMAEIAAEPEPGTRITALVAVVAGGYRTLVVSLAGADLPEENQDVLGTVVASITLTDIDPGLPLPVLPPDETSREIQGILRAFHGIVDVHRLAHPDPDSSLYVFAVDFDSHDSAVLEFEIESEAHGLTAIPLGGASQTLAVLENLASFNTYSVRDTLAAAAAIDTDAFFAARNTQTEESLGPLVVGDDWEPFPQELELPLLVPDIMGDLGQPVTIAVLELEHSWQAPAYLGWGAMTEGMPTPAEMTAVFARWSDHYGAEVYSLTGPIATLWVLDIEQFDRDTALELARQFFVLDPDGYGDSPPTLSDIASQFASFNSWLVSW